jgi:transposase-like protein
MQQGKPRDPRKAVHWSRLIEQWRCSGRSVRDFCEHNGIAIPSFYAWRRRLQQDATRPDVSQPPEAVTFLPVHVQPEPSDQEPPLELVLANGRCLRIPPRFDANALRALLAVLEEPSC